MPRSGQTSLSNLLLLSAESGKESRILICTALWLPATEADKATQPKTTAADDNGFAGGTWAAHSFQGNTGEPGSEKSGAGAAPGIPGAATTSQLSGEASLPEASSPATADLRVQRGFCGQPSLDQVLTPARRDQSSQQHGFQIGYAGSHPCMWSRQFSLGLWPCSWRISFLHKDRRIFESKDCASFSSCVLIELRPALHYFSDLQ